MRSAPLPIAFGLLLGGAAWAGPWTQNQDQYYVKLGETLFVSDAFRDATGRLQTGVDYVGWTSAIYFELGLLDGLHVQGYVPHTAAANTFDNGNRYLSAGGGDMILGVQASVPGVDLPHGLRLDIKTPLYAISDIQGREAALFPLRGDGQIDTTVWLSVGGSVPQTSIYGFIEGGHRFRSERFTGRSTGVSFNDSLVGFGQVGVDVHAGVLLMANSNLVMPYGDDAVTKGYFTAGPGLYWPVGGGYAIEANWDPILWAVNSAEGYSVSLGLSLARR